MKKAYLLYRNTITDSDFVRYVCVNLDTCKKMIDKFNKYEIFLHKDSESEFKRNRTDWWFYQEVEVIDEQHKLYLNE